MVTGGSGANGLIPLHPVSLMQKTIDKFDDFLVEYPVCAISVAVV